VTTVRETRGPARPVRDDGRPVRALLADGTVVRLRELHDADAPAVAAFYRALPVYDRFLRFFSAGALPTENDLIGRRGPADVSLGAFRGETLVGVAQCAGTEDPSTAEVALAVAPTEQAHGMGTLLLEHVASRARRRGVRRFVADVLAENARIRQVLADVGLPVRRYAEDGQVHVEFDLDPDRDYLDALATREERADVASLAAVLAPRSIAVVGAGRGPESVGHAVLRNLVRSGFAGRLVAVNPHATQVCGVVCHGSVEDLTEPVDLAVLCVPAAVVPEVAEQCGRRGVHALLVITSGLSGDAALAGGLLDAVRRHDMRMVGPNCLGVANTDPAVRLDAKFAQPVSAGSVGLVTQSGGVAIAVQEELTRLGLGVSTAVSTGDKYDVSGNDLLLWWHGDPRTRLAVLHLESFGNPRKFSRFARRLAERIPVVTVRSGSSTAGQRAAASHTAATATPRVTRDALFTQAGVLAVDRLDELSELVATLSWQPLPAGRRTAVVANAGGAGVLAADACEARGLTVPPLSMRTQRALRGLLPAGAATANPVDTTAVVSPEVFASAVSAVRADPEVDAVLAVTVATALTDPFPGIAAAAAGPGGPVLAVRLGQAEHVAGVATAITGGTVPVFADAAAAAGALTQTATRAEWLARPRGTTTRITGIDRVRAGGVVAGFLAARPEGGWLEPAQVQDVLQAFGLPVLASAVVDGPDAAVAAFTTAACPVALKAVADGVLHKAAAGGVRLGLDSADAVRRAAADLAALFGSRLRGYLVQPMALAGAELLVGVTSEPVFGPLVAVGLGGTVTDLVADRAHRLVPLSDADAEEMLAAFRAGARLFDPHRTPPLDRGAVVDTVVRIGRLADELPEVAELDLNPVVVGAHGCAVVDARIRVAPVVPVDPTLRALEGREYS
jgi:acyl-CoA synthetase (NDP forming)/GNAT superfamily N-acetyltransferase